MGTEDPARPTRPARPARTEAAVEPADPATGSAGLAWEPGDEEGGDPVCWAHLVCPECGAIETEGHRAGCELAERARR